MLQSVEHGGLVVICCTGGEAGKVGQWWQQRESAPCPVARKSCRCRGFSTGLAPLIVWRICCCHNVWDGLSPPGTAEHAAGDRREGDSPVRAVHAQWEPAAGDRPDRNETGSGAVGKKVTHVEGQPAGAAEDATRQADWHPGEGLHALKADICNDELFKCLRYHLMLGSVHTVGT